MCVTFIFSLHHYFFKRTNREWVHNKYGIVPLWGVHTTLGTTSLIVIHNLVMSWYNLVKIDYLRILHKIATEKFGFREKVHQYEFHLAFGSTNLISNISMTTSFLKIERMTYNCYVLFPHVCFSKVSVFQSCLLVDHQIWAIYAFIIIFFIKYKSSVGQNLSVTEQLFILI